MDIPEEVYSLATLSIIDSLAFYKNLAEFACTEGERWAAKACVCKTERILRGNQMDYLILVSETRRIGLREQFFSRTCCTAGH